MCPGNDLARETVFLVVATFLWALNIEPACDDEGRPIIPAQTDLVDNGLVVYVGLASFPTIRGLILRTVAPNHSDVTSHLGFRK